MGKKAKIGEKAVNEANLSECYAVNKVSCRVNILINVNDKIIHDWTLIFKDKASVKAGDKCINHSIVDGKDATVISVQIQSL